MAVTLTNIIDKLVDMRFLQQAQLTHTGESIESFIDDKLLGVTQTLLQERLQDGGALPAHVRSHAFSAETHRERTQTGRVTRPRHNQ